MHVSGHGVGQHSAVHVPSTHDRELGLEVEFTLEEQAGLRGCRSHGQPGRLEFGRIGRIGDSYLAAAVVPADRRLESEWTSQHDGAEAGRRRGLPDADAGRGLQRGHCLRRGPINHDADAHAGPDRKLAGAGCKIGPRPNLAPGGDRRADPGQKAPLRQSVLGCRQHEGAGSNGDPQLVDGPDKRRVDLLQFVRHDGAALGQLQGAGDRIVRGHDLVVRDDAGRAVGVRVEDGHPVAQRVRGEPEHPAELAAPENPDRRARRDRLWAESQIIGADLVVGGVHGGWLHGRRV